MDVLEIKNNLTNRYVNIFPCIIGLVQDCHTYYNCIENRYSKDFDIHYLLNVLNKLREINDELSYLIKYCKDNESREITKEIALLRQNISISIGMLVQFFPTIHVTIDGRSFYKAIYKESDLIKYHDQLCAPQNWRIPHA